MMRYVAPYNDFASLRAPLVLQELVPVNSVSVRARIRGSMIAYRPAKTWIETLMLPLKPLTIGLRAMFPKIAL